MNRIELQPKSNWSNLAALMGRCLIGAVLLYAGYSKLTRPLAEFAAVIDAYQLVPTTTAIDLAGILPWIELFTGSMLLFGFGTWLASRVAMGLFSLFLIVLVASMVRGIHPESCGCFGAGLKLTPIQGIAADAILLAVSIFVMRSQAAFLSLRNWIEHRPPLLKRGNGHKGARP